MLATLMRLVGVVQLLLGVLYLAVPDWLLAAMGHSSIAADIRYPLGMLAARFLVYGAALLWAARQPQAHRPWIWGMVAIQLVDLMVGLRVSEEDEREGLDITSHGETAYSR